MGLLTKGWQLKSAATNDPDPVLGQAFVTNILIAENKCCECVDELRD